MADLLDFCVDGVLVRETDFSQFRTEPALRDWRKRVSKVFMTISGITDEYSSESFERRLVMMDQLDQITKPITDAMRIAAEDRKMSMPARNLDLVVIAQNENSRNHHLNYMMKNQTAGQVIDLLDCFERAEQMGSYEFDAYSTLGDDECERQGIETLHDMFGTEWAERFYRRKHYLIKRLELDELYRERVTITRSINELEAEIADLV